MFVCPLPPPNVPGFKTAIPPPPPPPPGHVALRPMKSQHLRAPQKKISTDSWTIYFPPRRKSIDSPRHFEIQMRAELTRGGPGEILALRWKWLTEQSADVQQRVYRGEVDVPKTVLVQTLKPIDE